MSTYKNLMSIICKEFDRAGFDNAEYEIRELMGKALDIDCRSGEFFKLLDDSVSGDVAAQFIALTDRRKNGEPLQYILGEWEFYGLPIRVGDGVLIPRQDTETLVEIAINKLSHLKNLTVLDLCSGSGCIALSLEKNLDCDKVFCVEKSPIAFKYLQQNINLNESSAQAVLGDVLDESTMQELLGADLIVCNPPYLTSDDMKNLQTEVEYEPETALFGGDDGLDFYRDITRLWKTKLKFGGVLMFEIGINQEQDVMQIMIQNGFINVRAKKDLCGVYRVVTGVYKSQD